MSSVNQRWHNAVTEMSSEKRAERVRARESVVLPLKRASYALTRVSMPRWDECLQA